MIKKKKMTKKIKKSKHKEIMKPQLREYWLVAIFVIIIGRAILLEPGIGGAVTFDPSLIMHDPLENEGTIIENNGIVSNVKFEAGHLGKSVFYGTDSSLTYNMPKNFNSNRGAIEMWIKPDWEPGAPYEDKHVFFSAYDKDSPKTKKMEFFYYPAHGTIVMKVTMDKNVYQALYSGSTNPWTKGQWHHIATSWGPKYGVRVYLDGVERGFYRTGAGSIWDDVNININPSKLIIGNTNKADQQDYPAEARIDEIRIYNEEKTSFIVT